SRPRAALTCRLVRGRSRSQATPTHDLVAPPAGASPKEPQSMLPLIGALVGAGASIYGANKAASSAKKAARQQAAGIQRGIDESGGLYETGQNYLSPYVAQGHRYAGLMDDIIGFGGSEGQD